MIDFRRILVSGRFRLAFAIAGVLLLGGLATIVLHESGGSHAAESSVAGKAGAQYYTCGMHPWVILPKPGDCPICHMKLVPLDPAKFTGQIAIDPVVVQNIGVRVAPATVGEVTRTVRTVGSVEYDETRVRDVNLKIAGWIEKLHVDSLGQPVKKGEPLLEIYSPELYSAEAEYLAAFRRAKAGQNADRADRMDAELLAAARKRLEYFDVPAGEVRELERTGEVRKALTIRSPFDGVVVEKMAQEGMKADAAMRLYRIADLSTVWVQAAVYEQQLPYVREGQAAAMTLPYLPGRKFDGKVAYVYPYLDRKLRQVNVRLEFANPDLTLKPGMFASVELRGAEAKQGLLVPREAVIDTGERQVAFVSLGKGRFEPRDVKLGVEADGGKVEILEGLKPGEMVVTSGQFLLDSESRLREALARMMAGTTGGVEGGGWKVEGSASQASTIHHPPSTLLVLPAPAGKALAGMLDGYFAIGAKLADDTAAGIAEPARQVASSAEALLKVEIPGDPHFWHKHMEAGEVRARALELAGAGDLAKARSVFADLGTALEKLLKATGVPAGYGKEVYELHCPMYREEQGGAVWLQTNQDVTNPYYGKAMLNCGDVVGAVPSHAAPDGNGKK